MPDLSKSEVEKVILENNQKLDAMQAEVRAASRRIHGAGSYPEARGPDGGPPTIAEMIAAERSVIARSTNLAVCDADPLGDGDQSELARALPGTPTQALVDVWCAGTWLGMLLTMPRWGRGWNGDEALPRASADEVAPQFYWSCARGEWARVEAELAAVAGDAAATRALLETRATPLRLSALHLAASGARAMGPEQVRLAKLATTIGIDHGRVVAALLAAGANVRGRDVLGMTPWHHCLTSAWSPSSLDVARQLLRTGGVDANARNRLGRTVLVELSMQGPAALPAVNLAVEAGTDYTIPDSDGHTPLKMAMLNPAFRDVCAAAVRRKRVGANRLLEGVRVRLHSLKRAAELNGKEGVANNFEPSSARYEVLCDGSAEPISVAAANLIAVNIRERVRRLRQRRNHKCRLQPVPPELLLRRGVPESALADAQGAVQGGGGSRRRRCRARGLRRAAAARAARHLRALERAGRADVAARRAWPRRPPRRR